MATGKSKFNSKFSFMEEWRTYKYTDLCSLIGGGTPKTSESSYWGGDIPWLSVKDFGTGGKYVYSTEKHITEKGLNNSSTKLLQRDDIIISARGTIGAMAMIPFPMAFNQSCFGIRANNKVDPHFLFYLTKTKIAELQTNSHGSVFDTITRDTFDKIECYIPDISTQRRIATILSNLDDKILLNNRINHNLEEQAQALYKSWFVDFGPFKGGIFVDSEIGMIPKGWRIYKLTDIASISSGYSYKGSELLDSDCAMATIKNFDRDGSFKIEGYKEIRPSGKLKDEQVVGIYDVLVAHTDLTQKAEIIGSPAIILSSSGYKKLIMSMDLCKVTSTITSISQGLLYYLLKSSSFKQHALGYVNGTTVLHLSRKALLDFTIALPDDLSELDVISKSLMEKCKLMSSLLNEEIKLQSIRDALLPKLMSGSITC